MAVDEIADALQRVLSHRENAEVMGQAGRELVKERFTWDSIVPELDEVYRSLIRDAKS